MSNEEKEPKEGAPLYGVRGGTRPPGAGRAAGTPNKKTVAIEAILQERADKKKKTTLEVSALYRMYQIMDRDHEALGLKEGDITIEMSFDAAKHLSQFEAPKKKAVEVTGAALTGGTYVISTGAAPHPDETAEQWAERSRRETEELELELKKRRLLQLEEDKKELEESSKAGQKPNK